MLSKPNKTPTNRDVRRTDKQQARRMQTRQEHCGYLLLGREMISEIMSDEASKYDHFVKNSYPFIMNKF